MKELLKNSNYELEITIENRRERKSSKKYDTTSIFVLLFTILLAAGTMTYIVFRAHQTETRLTGNELRKLLQSILSENNEVLKNDDYIAELQLLDKNFRLIWFASLDEQTLKDEQRVEKMIEDELEDHKDEILWEAAVPSTRQSRSADSSQSTQFVVSRQTQFVNCEHFKPIPRGKYLVPPSLHALHTCYQYGVKMDELDRGIFRRDGAGELRYNLQELYVACDDVFNDHMDELTSELRNDYERCKWSGALDENQQKLIEDRFHTYFAPSNAPANLELTPSTTITAIPRRLDPRAYVECSHVETELFEDSFESPSPEALQRCRSFGVTYDELRRGFTQNPQAQPTRLDVANLYISCRDVFDGHVDYMTSELKDDYRRCKRMRTLSRTTQEKLEAKFYEALYDEKDTTSRRTERPSRTTTATEIVTTRSDDFERRTTTVAAAAAAAAASRSTFANCKRVENKDYYICIKVITSYNSPVISV